MRLAPFVLATLAALAAAGARAGDDPALTARVWQKENESWRSSGLKALAPLGRYGWARVEYGRTRMNASGSVEHKGAVEWWSPFMGDSRIVVRVERLRENEDRDTAILVKWTTTF